MRDLLPAVFSLEFPAGGSIPAQRGYLQLVAPGVKVQCIWDAHTGIADRQTDDRKQQHGVVFQSCVFKLERNECTEKVASLFLPCPNLASASCQPHLKNQVYSPSTWIFGDRRPLLCSPCQSKLPPCYPTGRGL